ncbi:hypothetical protein C1H46_005464 [Malus baccata]|uniref:Reduced growth phenotype protein 1 n=1 Tax=Malus baccata TaxID=106549 RepID=A0A540NDH9_MALBA|nr:hypothetical protein C1H46_005464 [Malus baccata]
MLPRRLSAIFGGLGSNDKALTSDLLPTLKLQTDKEVYRPGDPIVITVEISNPSSNDGSAYSLLIERLGFEIKGIEKLDSQWFATQKPTAGSKQRRGIVPSATIQMDMYWKEMDGDSDWVRANDIYDGVEEGYESSRDEISSVSSYNPMKEHVNRTFGSSLSLQSQRSSNKDSPYLEGERTSLSPNLAIPRLSVAEVLHNTAADLSSPLNSSAIGSPSQQQKLTKRLSLDDEARASSSPAPGAVETVASEGFIRGRSYNIRLDDQVLLRLSPKNSDSNYYFGDMIGGTLTFFHEEGSRRCLEVSITLLTSETISRRFVHPSRRNSPTITKANWERRLQETIACFIVLESYLGKNKYEIFGLSKAWLCCVVLFDDVDLIHIQSDHYEVVADLVQTSFLFSIPMDGPMSFSTPHVSVQWELRFEFFTTPKNVDWTRYEHPLLIEGRDKSEWVLPITVHAPPAVGPTGHARNEKSLIGNLAGA